MNRKTEQSGILRRGSACLSCRRRKLRCDGERPVCTPCKSMKRVHECNYDDSSKKTHTQTLREKVLALEAKVRELEASAPGSNSAAATAAAAAALAASTAAAAAWPLSKTIDADSAVFTHTPQPMLNFQEDVYGLLDPAMGMDNLWTIPEPEYVHQEYAHHAQFDLGDIPFDVPSSASSSSDGSMSRPHSMGFTAPPIPGSSSSWGIPGFDFNTAGMPPPAHPPPASQAAQCLSPEEYDNGSPKVPISRELHDTLLRSFLRHRKKCCFYSDTARFEGHSSFSLSSSSSTRRNGKKSADATLLPEPNAALMSAVYLLGCFFGPRDNPQLEQGLLEQTLAEVARLLHVTDKLLDTIQALCLLAQYYFFTNELMQGSRHLAAAKRIAFDAGLHQLSPVVFFQHEYAFASATHEFAEKAAVFWQAFMVSNLWSSAIDRHVLSPAFDPPCRHITTPLPADESLPMESVAGNSPLHALFDVDVDVKYKAKSLKPSAFRAMAACIFDHSVRVHNTASSDDNAYRQSAEVALDRINTIIEPLNCIDVSATGRIAVDADLYLCHALVVAATIHLHKDSTMDLKMSWAAKKVVEMVNYLTAEDYDLMDPVLSVCWSSVVRIFRGMIRVATQKLLMQVGDPGAASTASWTVNYLQSCVNALLSALQHLASTIPIAESLLTSLENDDTAPPQTLQSAPQIEQFAPPWMPYAYGYPTQTEYTLPEIFGF